MIEDFRLVICDIDSTLITSDRILTEHAKDVINRLHAHGVYFALHRDDPLISSCISRRGTGDLISILKC